MRGRLETVCTIFIRSAHLSAAPPSTPIMSALTLPRPSIAPGSYNKIIRGSVSCWHHKHASVSFGAPNTEARRNGLRCATWFWPLCAWGGTTCKVDIDFRVLY